ncbi:MAG: hypothetical protein B7Z37_25045 [Verrucomicrobia bacterium 12-59-8]|nr:MAG: hypothetical protein B7Z37_25045 [Verrucomicrobia bacterium 12-59-8]
MDLELERSRFEEAVFAAYYISTITRNPAVPKPRISGALDFVSQGCMMKDEFCARDPQGGYTQKSLSAMWFGWQLRAKEGRKQVYPSGPLIQLAYWFSPDQTILHIKPYDDGELGKLKELADELGEGFECDATMYCIFEQLVANSELTWVDANDTGDLTSAPMLGILGPDEQGHDPTQTPAGYLPVGCDKFGGIWQKIEARWAFMDYQVKSPQQDLLKFGYCRFIGGGL